jgi:hypothetical protein
MSLGGWLPPSRLSVWLLLILAEPSLPLKVTLEQYFSWQRKYS